MLAFSSMCIAAIIPLFAYTPIEKGGLALDVSEIGLALSGQSVCVVFFQSAAFPFFHKRLGTIKLYRTMIWFYSLGVLFFPLANIAALRDDMRWKWIFFAGALFCVSFGNM